MKRLFGADGIRGKIDEYPFRPQDQALLGQALAQWWLERTAQPKILLGTDTRESNQRIKVALVEGLTSHGVEVWDTGIIPTAAISYLVACRPELAGGLIISASHNPIRENGIKVFDERGMKIDDLEESAIEAFFFGESLMPEPLPQAEHAPIRQVTGFLAQYTSALIDEFKNLAWPREKILVDCANGAAFQTARSVFGELGLHCIFHNAVPDGTNINFDVGSEHIRKYPRAFAHQINKSGAQLGIAFDGDADRVVFVDRDGAFYDGDMLLAIAALALKEQGLLSGGAIVITQMSNSGLAEHLQGLGIQTIQVQNGDKYISDVLIRDNLALGGEQIGHLIFHTNPFHVTGDGLRTALFILAALFSQPGKNLRDLTHGFNKWPQVNVSVGLGGKTLAKTDTIPGLEELKKTVIAQISDLTSFECRPASTEPVYRIMLEAKTTPVQILSEHALGLAHHIQQAIGKTGEPVEMLDCFNGGLIVPGCDHGPEAGC